jgi:HSP20 family protein
MLLRRVWPSRPTFENPFADLDNLRREMLRVIGSVANVDGAYGDSAGVFPPLNLGEDDNNFYLRAEVPGIKAADLSISALPTSVSISGKREIANEQDKVSYHRKERAEGSFNRTLSLPSEIAPDKVEARCADGILSLTLPKAETAKPRQIAVTS